MSKIESNIDSRLVIMSKIIVSSKLFQYLTTNASYGEDSTHLFYFVCVDKFAKDIIFFFENLKSLDFLFIKPDLKKKNT